MFLNYTIKIQPFFLICNIKTGYFLSYNIILNNFKILRDSCFKKECYLVGCQVVLNLVHRTVYIFHRNRLNNSQYQLLSL